MAPYKKPCIHCGRLLDADARACPGCGSRSPLALRCPACLREIQGADMICSGCGRSLAVACPHCGQQTHARDRCERCGKNLLVLCPNRRCGELQFFDLSKCTACGKRLEPSQPAP